MPPLIHWTDVAGLVRGASRGEGLGNRFLATIRECDAVCHVLRDYEDETVVHVDGRVDASEDAAVVNCELVLADLAHVGRRLEKKGCDGEERRVLEKVERGLEEGMPARVLGLSEEEVFTVKGMGLLTLKPVLYVFNVDEVDFTLGREEALIRAKDVMKTIAYSDQDTDVLTLVSAKFEAEISSQSMEDRMEYLASLGLEQLDSDNEKLDDLFSYNTLPSLIQKILNLSVVYTGPGVPPERSQTTRAHLFRRGALTASDLAGRIHGDIQKGFIRAEVTEVTDLLGSGCCDCYTDAKEKGVVRTEGRDYVLEDGDVVLIKWK